MSIKRSRLYTFFIFISNLCPPFRSYAYHKWYNFIAEQDKNDDLLFMNLGFSELDDHDLKLSLNAADEPNREFIQLYYHLLKDISLENKSILEIGCGRGAPAEFITRNLNPKTYMAIDYSENAIKACRAHFNIENLEFKCANAQDLPFAESAFDIIINIESSHCYPNFKKFITEVHRTLKPGGYFCYADLNSPDKLERRHEQLLKAGFRNLTHHDITENILKALDAQHLEKAAKIQRKVHPRLQSVFAGFAVDQNSLIYTAMQNERVAYHSAIYQKLS